MAAWRLPLIPRRRARSSALIAVLLGTVLLAGVPCAAASTQATRAANDTPAAGVAPETLPKGSADAVSIFRWIGPGQYQLDVQNTSGIGYIDTFNWVPPVNLTVTSVTSTEGGHCSLVGGDIQCSGKIPPPTCTCSGGGDLVVNFTGKGLDPTFANGYWTYYGIVGAYLQIETMTPVPYHIPSFNPNPSADLPLCKKGHKSTKSNPCV
jgi:hypothetical protein